MQQRGYPGTHDLDLSSGILQSIKKLKTTGSVLCPQYDKSAYQGLGDRFPMSHWKKIDAPLDILFFEGWMLGFTPVPEKQLSDQNLKQINAILESYRVWNEVLDGFVHLSPSKISNVLNWRVEAEEKRKEQGFSGMSKNDVESYTRKFIPAYKTYLPNLTKSLGGYKNSLSFTIGENRLPVK